MEVVVVVGIAAAAASQMRRPNDNAITKPLIGDNSNCTQNIYSIVVVFFVKMERPYNEEPGGFRLFTIEGVT